MRVFALVLGIAVIGVLEGFVVYELVHGFLDLGFFGRRKGDRVRES